MLEDNEKEKTLPNCVCMDFIKEDLRINKAFENSTFTIYGNLQKTEKVLIKYSGKLIDSEGTGKNIVINLGFGNMWESKQNIVMAPCTHSDITTYCASIDITDNQDMMICFMDENNSWDLENLSSYIVPVKKEEKTIAKTLDIGTSLEVYEESPFQLFLKKMSKILHDMIFNIGQFFERVD